MPDIYRAPMDRRALSRWMPGRRRPVGRAGARWREAAVVACALLLSAVILGVFHYGGDPLWVRRHLPVVAGSDAALWQVQTTFLSVGFAGLAIAAQLFADAPLAIGTSRGRVLAYIGAGWFVTVGLIANAVMALETIWLPSATGVAVAFAWFVATAVLLLVSTSRLTQLFGHPSQLDEVVRSSLVETLSDRLDQMSRRYADETKGLDDLLAPESMSRTSAGSASTLRVAVPEAGRVVKAIKTKAVRQAIASLASPATDRGSMDRGAAEEYVSPRIVLDVHPGDRTRLGDTAFRVVTPSGLDPATAGRVVRLLQSSIELEPPGAVTPFEETEHEIAMLKDAIATNLRSGALATAERALELLGHVVRGVWMTETERSVTLGRRSWASGGGLFQSIGEVEQDLLLSPQVAQVFISAATTRALEAPGTGSTDYVDVCLRSFTRQWSDILRHGGPEFESLPVRIATSVQHLAAYSDPSADGPEGLRSRGVWAMVELVKLALDAKRPDVARIAAVQLQRLFELDRQGAGRTEVRAGQLVLSGWLDYLAGTKDDRSAPDPVLREALLAEGSRQEIIDAGDVIRRWTPFNGWDTWETGGSASGRFEPDQLPRLIDRAQLSALLESSGSLPAAADQETASRYGRLLGLLPDGTCAAGSAEGQLKERLEAELDNWDAGESDRLALQPVSEARIASLAASLREALTERQRLSDHLPADTEVPARVQDARPILGMDFRVPRRGFTEGASTQPGSDAAALGRMIANAFTQAEDRKVVAQLRALQPIVLGPTAPAIRDAAEALGDAAQRFVLLTPYGGFAGRDHGHAADFAEALDRVTHVETGALDDEAILFDRQSTLRCRSRAEERDGVVRVEGTALALGVFDDVRDVDGSTVRVELRERFQVWPGETPRIFRLACGA